ncbi:MlaD family protein [Planctomicrobium piriforme]|uniref:Phospholipid/cholesterol/gamma-HCH transport system substrate-binding protein n=1 Tax=Planctomicrobium piriforme TaxID=1576369 RepID=A0A1I3MUM6_9PLAN|nr:MlaD family protein [Planctomicrobium piriforme]SFJ00490.1 phospholipid/cholesterol/gamma-HCH transport system substrate-binding protein [Planctomicrobium piriforme]
MTERQLQFRVGIFVVLAMAVGAVLIFQFSEFKHFWQKTYPLAVHFQEVPGLHAGSPVKQNGITIGVVKEMVLDDDQGGVLVIVEIFEGFQIRADSQPHLSRSFFGDAKIDFSPGRSTQMMPPRTRVEGVAATDPMLAIERLERTVGVTLTSFETTSQEWKLVGKNLNELMDTNRGNLNDVIERTAIALDRFNQTMETASATFVDAGEALRTASSTLANANTLLADPQLQRDLRQTAASLPLIAEETRQTIAAARASMAKVTENLDTIQQATLPLAKESDVIARKLSSSLIQLESLLTELNQFSQMLNAKDGSLQKFASDPQLYQHLNRSASSLAVLLENLDPALRDLKIFADKVARHPELLGVSGAMRGSTGIKDAPEVQQTGFSTPGREQR